MAESLGFNYELKKFSGIAPIFPLPNVVFLPKTLLPLHIFEPRYQEMTNDVLNGERIICVTLLEEGWEEDYLGEPPIHQIGTIGYVERHEPKEEGKSNILLNGLAKVKIQELPKSNSYRVGQMEIIEDTAESWQAKKEKSNLMQRFRQIARLAEEDIPFEEIEQADISLEVLVNLLATWLPIPVTEKQKLLEVDDLVMRSEIVRQYLRHEVDDLSFLDNLDLNFPDDPRMN